MFILNRVSGSYITSVLKWNCKEKFTKEGNHVTVDGSLNSKSIIIHPKYAKYVSTTFSFHLNPHESLCLYCVSRLKKNTLSNVLETKSWSKPLRSKLMHIFIFSRSIAFCWIAEVNFLLVELFSSNELCSRAIYIWGIDWRTHRERRTFVQQWLFLFSR